MPIKIIKLFILVQFSKRVSMVLAHLGKGKVHMDQLGMALVCMVGSCSKLLEHPWVLRLLLVLLCLLVLQVHLHLCIQLHL